MLIALLLICDIVAIASSLLFLQCENSSKKCSRESSHVHARVRCNSCSYEKNKNIHIRID